MELVALLRLLWRHRLVVGLGGVAAIALSLTLFKGDGSQSAVASTRVVLDTPKSQLVYPDPEGADTLAWRAALLADLMASRPVTTRIARDLGTPADSLVVVAPYLTVPALPTPLSQRASEVAAVTQEPYVLVVRFDDRHPIISIEGRARTRTEASRLAKAATDALTAAAPAPQNSPSPEIQEFVLERVGPIRAKKADSESRGLVVALGMGIVMFGCWCGCVALVSGLARATRTPRRMQPAAANGP